jgi:2-polyprenyl-3-methyl-5-hydroxy-6-metoxy-1,4-benzoquinol methylase
MYCRALAGEMRFALPAMRNSVNIIDDALIGNQGERQTVEDTFSYYAHLSIYRCALPFAEGHRVLDVGSGAGYGSAYLARNGATEVLALDAGIDAIAYSRQHYSSDAVTFAIADLNLGLPIGDRSFDLVFSSNVFEHVGDVDGLAAECARVVAASGVVFVAVPAIRSSTQLEADIVHHWHVHHIPPIAWHAKLSRFFSEVRCYGHLGSGEFADLHRLFQEMALPPGQGTIRETDFIFPEADAAEMGDTITAIFVCRNARAMPEAETLLERTPSAWREGEIAARVIAHEREIVRRLLLDVEVSQTLAAKERKRAEQAEATVVHLSAQVAALNASTSWRLTAPARAIVRAIYGR